MQCALAKYNGVNSGPLRCQDKSKERTFLSEQYLFKEQQTRQ